MPTEGSPLSVNADFVVAISSGFVAPVSVWIRHALQVLLQFKQHAAIFGKATLTLQWPGAQTC